MPLPAHPLRTLAAVPVAGVLALAALAAPAAGHTGATLSRGVSPKVVVTPHFTKAVRASETTFTCQSPTASVVCYSPRAIRTAYDIQSVLNSGVTGAGRTIVIIDAFGYPTLRQDLHVFDQTFGLPDPHLRMIAPDGTVPFDPKNANQVGWSGEIALDVEWAHAVAPGAQIDLVIARTNNDADILSATKYAVDNNLGAVISQSFGEAETCEVPSIFRATHNVFNRAAGRGITLLASSGDQGSAQPTCDGSSYFLSASTPASDPLVTAVGGTHLNADPVNGTYHGEHVWNNRFGASGGGFSTAFDKPSYQYGLRAIGRHRGVPDVSYNGDVNGGVLTAWSQGVPGNVGQIYIFGGTSAGSPQWAGIVALASQQANRRLGQINPGIYQLGHSSSYRWAFHDVTSGDNTFVGTDSSGHQVVVTGYYAGRGWDASTGWGSPDVAHLIPLLIPLTYR